jgi:hypothetical protein
MAEKQKTLTYEGVTLTVVRTTALMESKRMRMISEAMESKDPDPDAKTLRLVQYPNCICCTTQVEGIPWPITFEQFKELDGALVNAWHAAALEINPHWYETMEAGEEAEAKKAS